MAHFALVLFGGMRKHPDQFRAPIGMYHNDNDIAPHYFVDATRPWFFYERNLMNMSGGRAMWDVFIHSNVPSTQVQSRMLQLYQPVSAHFDNKYGSVWRRGFERLAREHGDCKSCPVKGSASVVATESRWFSVGRALRLVREAEQTRGRRYARVFITRPDVDLVEPVDVRKYCAGHAYREWSEPPYLQMVSPGAVGEYPADWHLVLESTAAERFGLAVAAHHHRYMLDGRTKGPGFNNDLARLLKDEASVEITKDHLVQGKHILLPVDTNAKVRADRRYASYFAFRRSGADR